MVKFLVIRFSSIGDIVLTTPVLRILKQQVSNSEIHYLTKKQYVSVITANTNIDKIHIFDNDLPKLLETLKHEHFDYIIDLHNNIRSRRVKQYLGMLAFSFKKLNWEKWLMVHFKINKLPDMHIVDRYLDTIKIFDIKNDNKGLDYFIPPNDELNLSDLPAGFQNSYIGFVIGAQHSTKKMPNEKIAEICAKIQLPIILLGGPDDINNANNIISQTKKKSKINNKLIFNSCGKFSINQSASLVKQASLIISHDTGLMHIAAAFKKIIISIWGNTIPEFGMYPYLSDKSSTMFQVENLKCRPCTKIGFSKCHKKHFNCMNNQNIDDIAELVNKTIS